MRRAVVTLVLGALVAALALISGNERALAQGGADAATVGSQGCFLQTRGALTTNAACFVETEVLGADAGHPSPRVFIRSVQGPPEIDVWFEIVGPPRAGTPLFAGVIRMSQPPAAWQSIARSTGDFRLTVSESTRVVVDGGVTHRFHGSFEAVLPEVTGVRGPDVVVRGMF